MKPSRYFHPTDTAATARRREFWTIFLILLALVLLLRWILGSPERALGEQTNFNSWGAPTTNRIVFYPSEQQWSRQSAVSNLDAQMTLQAKARTNPEAALILQELNRRQTNPAPETSTSVQ